MIATLLLGVCWTAAGPDGPPKLKDLRTSSSREVLAGSGADDRRRRAPEDEVVGKTGGRPEHLGLAPKADPEDVTARGLLGLVRYRDEWVEPDAVAARVRADADQAAALEEYHARRDRTPDKSVAQLELADWCEHRGLKAEAIAHLTAVTRLDPNYSSPWSRLGYRSFHGRWMTEGQYAAEKAAAEEQKEADHYWEPHLVALTRRLGGPEPGREPAERELAGVTDPRAVAAIWQTFAKGKPARLDLAVRLLGQIDSPESSRRLAALILADPRWGSEEEVGRGFRWVGRFMGSQPLRQPAAEVGAEREATPGHQALTILRHRDPRDFIGALIESMQAPVTVSVQRGTSFDTGTLHVESETLDLRRTYVSRRGSGFSPVPGAGSTVKRDLNHDYQKALHYRASVDQMNLKVSNVLRELTGQVIDEPDPARVRDAWRSWWADEQGYSYTPGAPRRKRTVTSVVVITHSCFAAGTPVRTLLGMRPIESIQLGDQVLAQDVTTGALGFEPVVAIYHNPPKPTLRIDLGDEVIVATPIHRFWKAGQGWAMARNLRPGDTIRRLGGTARVVSVSEEKVQPVFNLDVARCRSFFVGASGALVHDNSLVDPVLHPFDAPKAPAAAAAGAR
jgi:Pretoxin HINT domain